MAKRRYTEANWSDLQVELLHLILKKLALMDIVRFNSVCCSWHMAAESYISSPVYTPSPQIPCLMLATNHHQQEAKAETDADADARCGFFSASENKIYKVKNTFGGFHDAWCVGSSTRWLLIFDKQTNRPHLVHLFSGTKIQLPWLIRSYGDERVDELRKFSIVKFILLSHPSHTHSNNYTVVVLYRVLSDTRLALCKNGDKTWTHFATRIDLNCYLDLIFRSSTNQLYAITYRGAIEVWDTQGNLPRKITYFRSTRSRRELIQRPPNYQIDVQNVRTLFGFYMVESLGELLLVSRLLVEYTGSHPRYSTVKFLVFKWDCSGKKWLSLKTLSGRALFVGRNQSISLSIKDFPECEEDSIYYLDDRLENRNHGSDIGVYNLKENRFKRGELFNLSIDMLPPNPWLFWFVPS